MISLARKSRRNETQNTRTMQLGIEGLETRRLMAADLMGGAAVGDAAPAGTTDYFVADSFSFGAEQESGEKGGTADINIGIGEESAKPVAYLKYKLDRCFIKSWSTSGDADDRPTEEVAFYYNKIGFANAGAADVVLSAEDLMVDP